MIKEGDKVRIREDLVVDNHYGHDIFVGEMEQYKGGTATVTRTFSNSQKFRLDIDGESWQWTPEMVIEIGSKSTKKNDTKLKRAVEESAEKWRNIDEMLSHGGCDFYDIKQTAKERCGFCYQYSQCHSCPVEKECNEIEEVLNRCHDEYGLDHIVDLAFSAINSQRKILGLELISRGGFSEDDLITGTEKASREYVQTTEDMRIGRISSVRRQEGTMLVKILVHKNKAYEGNKWRVKADSELFEKVELD